MSMTSSSRIGAVSALTAFALVLLCGVSARAGTSEAVYQAKKRVTEAENQLRQARAGLVIEAERLMKASEQTPQWQKAAGALKDAQGRHAQAVRAAKAALASNADYKAAIAERNKCVEKREALRHDPTATPEQRTDAAIGVLSASSAVSKLEQRALADDPAVAQAQSNVDQSQFVMDELRKAAALSASKDPAYQSAKQRVDAAAAQVNQANQQVAEAKKQQAITEEQNLDQEIENKRNQLFGNNRR
jgi:hypothetical protein